MHPLTLRLACATLVLGLIAFACADGDALLEEVDPDAIPPVVTWDDHVAPLMERHCTGCHSAAITSGPAEGLDLSRFEVAACALEDILEVAVEEGSMPPGGARRLDGWGQAVLRRWAAQRAPRALGAGGAPVVAPLNCDFDDDDDDDKAQRPAGAPGQETP